MFKNGFFSKQFKRLIKENNSEKGSAKTTFYRSHYLKKQPDGDDLWSTKIDGLVVTGKLENIKKSVDSWCDNKIVIPPDSFESLPGRPTNRQVVEYKGFKIINDKGGEKDWYVTHKGKLLKGSRVAIENKIDQAIQRLQARKEAMVSKSIKMANNIDKRAS
ncbi:DUF3319 domain-containing protein [Vibrio sp. HN007]|uniref:DUF3319 domain-containing protein n=1 Tax=Vibrio iocasae TaxID=3098914 RepID=UPI0035D48304